LSAHDGVLVSQFNVYARSNGFAASPPLPRTQPMVWKHEVILCAVLYLLKHSCFPLRNAEDPSAVHQLMSSLDANYNGELNFLEFWQLIGHLTSKHKGFSQSSVLRYPIGVVRVPHSLEKNGRSAKWKTP
uniref:EF-hand domain-containing protein n=1 Tax=Acanthochromis polyacanthus TaxID=80966 RepID=A0A3Q1GR01_9TELE